MSVLNIENLHVEIEGNKILKGVNLIVKSNEIHALMGPNGNGKSTLVSTIMGHPKYEVTEGSITFDGEDVLSMEVDKRSKVGLFLGMQYPQEVSGVTNSDFLKAAVNSRRETPISLFSFIKDMEAAVEALEMNSDLAHRYVNEGFSGGEKKRNEILQMLLLKPKIAMLDEIDSGLDIDALRIVARVINNMVETQDLGMIIVSHYERFFHLITPTHTHVMLDGKIVMNSDASLVSKIDSEGYEWIAEELGVQIAKEEKEAKKKPISIVACAANEPRGKKNDSI
jgi:Fe-S cluster assembly ATP-binding protein